MILLQLSAAHGPDECCLAVALAWQQLLKEANSANINVDELEQEAGPRTGTLRSVLVSLSGSGADTLATAWCGTVQWQCESPWRRGATRKNWFIGVAQFRPDDTPAESSIIFESLKSSGPGGQHVNKTESAIRATHIASGITVKVQSERSQHANKRLAIALITHRLTVQQENQHREQRAERRMFHHQIARGNPVRVFKGKKFLPA